MVITKKNLSPVHRIHSSPQRTQRADAFRWYPFASQWFVFHRVSKKKALTANLANYANSKGFAISNAWSLDGDPIWLYQFGRKRPNLMSPATLSGDRVFLSTIKLAVTASEAWQSSPVYFLPTTRVASDKQKRFWLTTELDTE